MSVDDLDDQHEQTLANLPPSDSIPCPDQHDTTPIWWPARRAFLLATEPPTWFCITCKIEGREPIKRNHSRCPLTLGTGATCLYD